MLSLFSLGITATIAAEYPPLGPVITIEPKSEHTHTMIFMHGVCGSADGVKYLFEAGGPLQNDNLKVILPTAPLQYNGFAGTKCNSWFNMEPLT